MLRTRDRGVERRTTARFSSLCLAALLASACSSSPSGATGSKGKSSHGSSGGKRDAGIGFGNGPSGDASVASSPLPDAAWFDAGPPPACATAHASSELQPVYLAFAFDVSGSMGKGDKPWHDKTLKWDPIVAATRAFFSDPASGGLTASLTFFPAASDACVQGTYENPDVPMTALPSDAFGQAIAAIEPKTADDWRGGTPTVWVERGTRAFIAKYRVDHPGRYALVFVTDGYPEGCDAATNQIAVVADDLATALKDDSVSTYVIGVDNPPISGAPDTVSNLTQLAQAGGTDKAFLIDTGDAQKTVTDFSAAIETIRGRAITCEVKVPETPDGRVFDKRKIRVSATLNATPTDLVYDAACSADHAWHYDDPSQPSAIELCPSTCQQVQADASSTLDVEFVCEPVLSIQ